MLLQIRIRAAAANRYSWRHAFTPVATPTLRWRHASSSALHPHKTAQGRRSHPLLRRLNASACLKTAHSVPSRWNPACQVTHRGRTGHAVRMQTGAGWSICAAAKRAPSRTPLCRTETRQCGCKLGLGTPAWIMMPATRFSAQPGHRQESQTCA